MLGTSGDRFPIASDRYQELLGKAHLLCLLLGLLAQQFEDGKDARQDRLQEDARPLDGGDGVRSCLLSRLSAHR